jgi:hypothetical protein
MRWLQDGGTASVQPSLRLPRVWRTTGVVFTESNEARRVHITGLMNNSQHTSREYHFRIHNQIGRTTMKTKFFAPLLILGLAVTGVAGADSFDKLGWVDVQLVNSSGYTIRKLYLSPSDDTDWGRDLLGSGVLRSGYVETITTPPGRYDLRLVDADGNVCEISDVQMDEDRDVTLTRNGLLHCEGN